VSIVVFLRGVNVGGHRRFRPRAFAKKLRAFEVVNVGAAGTFVVRKPGSLSRFRAELCRRLPFETEIAICNGRDILRLETENPFGANRSRARTVQFVSILSKAGRKQASFPISIPRGREWFIRLVSSRDRFVFGEYRRHMKTIRYLGQIDQRVGAPVTTRNWSTIITIARVLKDRA
jgi:uncharacterized protein (DUF1697 family)